MKSIHIDYVDCDNCEETGAITNNIINLRINYKKLSVGIVILLITILMKIIHINSLKKV